MKELFPLMYECVFSRNFNCNFKEFCVLSKGKLVQRKVEKFDVKIFFSGQKNVSGECCAILKKFGKV
jgi:hypothetical protein